LAIAGTLGALCSVSIYRMVIECDMHPSGELDNRLNLPVLLATFTIQIINLLALGLYFNASKMNQRYVKE